MSEDLAAAPPPRRRRRLRWLLVAFVALALALALAIGLSPMLRWSAQALASPAGDAAAWRRVPADRPVVAALDVRLLLGSSVARALRGEIETLARLQGFDLALAERNAHLLVMASDGRGFVHGAATGPRLSPLLLPRFDPRWRVVGEEPGGQLVTDGGTAIRALEPGVVAFAVSESGEGAEAALEAGLEAASRASQEPLLLDGAALRILVTPDEALRRRMVAGLPPEAAAYAAGMKRLDARATCGESLDAVIAISMDSEESAAMTLGALKQLDQVLSSGLIAFLVPFLGEDAAILGRIPPFDVTRDGLDIVVTISATPDELRGLLSELQARAGRPAR